MKKLLNTLYVTEQTAFLSKSNDALLVRVDGEKALQLPFHILESIVMYGPLGCTPAVLGECAARGITLSFLDEAGHFLARVDGPISGNVLLRRVQYRISDNEEKSLQLAQCFIAAKVHNSKIVLQRYRRDYPDDIDLDFERAISDFGRYKQNVFQANDSDELRGIEGNAAHVYFSVFPQMIRIKDIAIEFQGRIRRPPTDPINAMLSFFYSILSRDIVSACETVGLDPQVGFLHKDRPGRASLALDIAEEMRAYCVDRFVLSLFNRKQIDSSDFDFHEGGGVYLHDTSRKKVLGLWQSRKQEKIVHPFLGEKIMIGLLPFVQVQLLARCLRGDLKEYPAFLWR